MMVCNAFATCYGHGHIVFSDKQATRVHMSQLGAVIHYKKDPTVDKKQQIISHYFAVCLLSVTP
jgi:hypothetical protein